MLLPDAMLFAAIIAALAVGSLRPSWTWLVACDAGLTVAAWVIRFLWIVRFGDVSVAEDYINGMTILNAAAEVAAFFSVAIICSSLGCIIARFMRRPANGN